MLLPLLLMTMMFVDVGDDGDVVTVVVDGRGSVPILIIAVIFLEMDNLFMRII